MSEADRGAEGAPPIVTAGAGPEGEAPVSEGSGAAPPRGAWGRLRRFADHHPMILAWIALSIGMVAILLYTSKDVGLQPSQTFAMVLATVALAAACVWIITWD